MQRVLLIEDDTVLRENIAEILELENYKVFTAPNGRVGIEKAKKEHPDLIICDIMMAEIDGYGVLEAVSLDPTTTNIPFIFLSARAEHKDMRRGMDMGADDYIAKPFEEAEFLSAIQSRIAKSRIRAKVLKDTSKKNKTRKRIRNLHELKNLFDDTGEIRRYQKGQVIFTEGDHSHNIYLILRGVVKSHKMEANGKMLITALHKSDDFLGFTSFADNFPYQETATAVEEVKLAGISKNELKKILDKNLNISLDLMNVLAENISEIKEQLLHMAYNSAQKKTAQTIILMARILNVRPGESLKIARSDLASMAGIATESLIRTLSVFRKKGFIKIDGRNIKILQLNSLKEVE